MNHFIHRRADTNTTNSAVIYCLRRNNAHKPLQCTFINQEQMDTHSMASKVNREVCQLKVNGCLLNTSVCFDFTVGERRRRISDSGTVTTSRCFFLVCSLGGSRGQDLIRQLSYQFTKPAFDKGRMKQVLFILCSVRDCSPARPTCLCWGETRMRRGGIAECVNSTGG